MWCIVPAYDNVINGIKEHFHHPDFEISKHIQNIFINAVNQKCFEILSVYLKKCMKEIFTGRT